MWKKRREDAVTIEDVIEMNSGLTIDELLLPSEEAIIHNADNAADLIVDSAKKGVPITIYGDYDTDGVLASEIISMIIQANGGEATVRLPKRYSEGFGMTKDMIDEAPIGLIITVDNGISENEAISYAKTLGHTVIIIDHHEANNSGELPPADIIVNPKVYKNGTFDSFCGAGLAYRIACLALDDDKLLDTLVTYACVATIADVVPVIHDNRCIIMRGLEAINQGKGSKGLNALISEMNLFDIDESDIGFKIAPAINAPGRLYDDGAFMSYQLIAGQSSLEDAAHKLVDVNDLRKKMQIAGIAAAEKYIESNNLLEYPLLFINCNELDLDEPVLEGICGIIAGRLTEKYNRPSLVLTPAQKKRGCYKGSGRSSDDIHLKNLLDMASEFIENHGGHAGAAGLTVNESDMTMLEEKLCSVLGDNQGKERFTGEYFDLEIEAKDVHKTIDEIEKYSPYGEGNARIILKINKLQLCPKGNSFYELRGENEEHFVLNLGHFLTAVGFNMTGKMLELDQPAYVDILGTYEKRKFKSEYGKKYINRQIVISDIKRSDSSQLEKNSLQASLAEVSDWF